MRLHVASTLNRSINFRRFIVLSVYVVGKIIGVGVRIEVALLLLVMAACCAYVCKGRKLSPRCKVFFRLFPFCKHYLSFCFIKLTFFYLNGSIGDIFLLLRTLGLLVRNINVLLRGKNFNYII